MIWILLWVWVCGVIFAFIEVDSLGREPLWMIAAIFFPVWVTVDVLVTIWPIVARPFTWHRWRHAKPAYEIPYRLIGWRRGGVKYGLFLFAWKRSKWCGQEAQTQAFSGLINRNTFIGKAESA